MHPIYTSRWVILTVVCCIAAALIGCALRGPESAGVGVSTTPAPAAVATTGAADVLLSFQVSTTATPTTQAAVRAAAGPASVRFRLLTLNIGQPALPTIATEQTILVPPSGRVSATFTAVPALPTIAQVEGINAVIGSYSTFHGARDLHVGANVITVAPVGSNWRHDIAAQVLENAILDATVFAKLTATAAATALNVADAIDRSQPAAPQDAVRAFVRAVAPPRWALSAATILSAQTRALAAAGQPANAVTMWVPGDTYVTESCSQESLARICGWSTPAELDVVASLQADGAGEGTAARSSTRAVTLPASIDWRNRNGTDWLGGVRNQFPRPTSVAFACCSTLEAMARIDANLPDFDLSEWFLMRFGQANAPGLLDQGWSIQQALEVLKTSGTVSEKTVPYGLIPFYNAPPETSRRFRAASYQLLQGTDAIKQALQAGPVITGMRVYEDFARYSSGIYWHAEGRQVGHQAIVLVGYNDADGCWIARNSWSSNWGENGYFRIRFGELGARAYQVRFSFTDPVPAAPAGLTAVPGDREATLSWSATSGARSYTLYYGSTQGTRRETGVRVGGVTSPHRLGGLQNGTTYYCVLTCENETGESALSQEMSVTPRDPAALIPANAHAVAGDRAVTVTWSSVAPASSYRLYWSTTPGSARSSGTVIDNANSPFSHTALANGTTYYYQVTAIVGGVESGPSPEFSARPWPGLPGAPTGLRADAGNAQTTVSWNPVAGADRYNLYFSNVATVNRTSTLIASVSSPFVHRDRPNGTTVYYVVTAANMAGESAESTAAAATPVLPAPTGVNVVRGSSAVTVNWSPVPGSSGYNIYYSESPLALRTAGVPVRNVQPGTSITGLVNGRTYFFQVTALDTSVESVGSMVASDQAMLAPASNLRVSGTRGRIGVTWDANVGTTYGIKLYYSIDNGTTWLATTHVEGATTGIAPGTNQSVNWVSHQDFAANQGQVRARVVLNDGVMDSPPIDSGAFTIDNRVIVTSVTSNTSDGVYGPGAAIDVQVTFSTPVLVTGTPQLLLETGVTDRQASYLSGNNSNTLSFRYVVQNGDVASDLDFANSAALALNGGTIRDDAGNNATLTLPGPGAAGSLGAAKAIVVDGIAPTLVSVTSTSPDGDYGSGRGINVTLNFSEPVTLANGDLRLDFDTAGSATVAPFAPAAAASTTYVVSAPEASADLDTVGLTLVGGATLRDAAGNDVALAIPVGQSLKDSRALVVDTIPPQIQSIRREIPLATTTNALSVTWRVTFSRAIDPTTVQLSDFTLGNSPNTIVDEALNGLSQVDATSWDVTATTGTSGDGTLSLGSYPGNGADIRDAIGNPYAGAMGPRQNYTIDKTPPTFVAMVPFDTNAVDLKFSENMVGLTTPGGISVSGAGINSLSATPDTIASVSIVTGMYRLEWATGAMLADSTLTVSTSGLTDVAGNSIQGVTSITDQTPLMFIDTVVVGDPGNQSDPVGYGGVAVAFRIGKYEITNTQYCTFLNAVAQTDTYGLYYTLMAGTPASNRGGIDRSGSSGSYVYSVVANMGDKPVNYVSFLGAARFANWMHNGGRNGGSTETGAYTITGGGDNAGTVGGRQNGARFSIPNASEWHKAAHYKGGGTNSGYWQFATQSDATPTVALANPVGSVSNPGVNVANYDMGAVWNGQNANFTTVGSCGASSCSAYGTADQTGNVSEWTETYPSSPPFRATLGGNSQSPGSWLRWTALAGTDQTERFALYGFRVRR